MGRLTLNVLLSFAQFEREVTGERIRDKIAASKRKGLWMGGVVPHGYRVVDRHLVVDDAEAQDVRLIFTLYETLKSIPALAAELDKRGLRTRVRQLSNGKTVGGVAFMTGALGYLLGNRVYLGEINHRGQSYPGEHAALIDANLFERVQSIKRSGLAHHRSKQSASQALLAGLLFDDRGNRMTPVHATKGSIRYRYYQSWVLAHGQRHKAGSVYRVAMGDIDTAVIAALKDKIVPEQPTHQQLRSLVSRIEVRTTQLVITFDAASPTSGPELIVPWSKPTSARKTQIVGHPIDQASKPIRSKARTRLLIAIAQGRRWLAALMQNPHDTTTTLASRHSVSEKTIRSMISLAFLAPDIVQAAIDGRLPRGLGLSRLTDLPPDWTDQRRQLGIA
jgi:site-specific DNA recombinase